MNSLKEDVAVIRQIVANLDEKVDNFNKKCDKYDEYGIAISEVKTKINILSWFAVTLNIITGAIASYFGVNLKK